MPHNAGIHTHRTTQYGNWRWNEALFRSKIGDIDPKTGCTEWNGFNGPHTALFGATKNGKPQMVQARRILAMSEGIEDMENKSIRMRCGNRYCMTLDHMAFEPNRRKNIKRGVYVPKGFVETRMSLEKYENLDEDTIATIKKLVYEFKGNVKFDYEWNYYSITWPRYEWLWAKLKAPIETEHLTVIRRVPE